MTTGVSIPNYFLETHHICWDNYEQFFLGHLINEGCLWVLISNLLMPIS